MSGFSILPDPNKFRLEPGAIPAAPPIFYPSYGLLYNWYAATDARNICAAGWHVPTYAEFQTLITYLGGDAIAGGPLKETGLVHWDTPNTDATNSSGFTGVGGGYRSNGNFLDIMQIGFMWQNEEFDVDYAYATELNYSFAGIVADLTYLKSTGYSVRPVKDSTILTHGQTGTYTGNDGKVYRTICIGTQEWLADNLAETKYRDGSDIPEVTSGIAWAALTSGALCAYNNDWSNV